MVSDVPCYCEISDEAGINFPLKSHYEKWDESEKACPLTLKKYVLLLPFLKNGK